MSKKKPRVVFHKSKARPRTQRELECIHLGAREGLRQGLLLALDLVNEAKAKLLNDLEKLDKKPARKKRR